MIKKIKVAAYCRVSTDKTDQVNSLKSQREYFNEYINKDSNWELVEIYYDEGISGTSTKKRHGFNRMIDDALNNNKIDLILTKEVSRFARNTVDTLSYTRNLKSKGVGVKFISDNIDTRDSDGELRLSIMATIAQEESRKTSERVKWGQKRKMEQGVVFGRDMLGYFVKDGQLIINPDEIEVVKRIFNKYTNEGKGTTVIARELIEEGYKPKKVKNWSNTVILRVLRNEKYVGDLRQKKTYTPDYLTHSKKYNRGHEEMVCLKDHHEAIIDRDLWERTQIELSKRTLDNEQKSKHSNRYWCSGKIFCGECDSRYISRRKKYESGKQYKAWKCQKNSQEGALKIDEDGNKKGCNNNSIHDEVLKQCALQAIEYININRENLVDILRKQLNEVNSKIPTLDKESTIKKIENIKNKKAKTTDLMIEGILPKSDYIDQLKYYDDEIETLAIRIKEIENSENTKAKLENDFNKYVDKLHNIIKHDKNDKFLSDNIKRINIIMPRTMDIYLSDIPYMIRLKYETSGKRYGIKLSINEIKLYNVL